MASTRELSRIFKFIVIGLLNTCIGLSVIYACKYLAQIGDIPANAIGYAVALANSFVWNRRWTFAHAGKTWPAVWRFIGVFFVAYMANLVTLTIGINRFDFNSYFMHAVGAVPYTVIFYLGSRFFVFSR